jgi:hypothetical protein
MNIVKFDARLVIIYEFLTHWTACNLTFVTSVNRKNIFCTKTMQN